MLGTALAAGPSSAQLLPPGFFDRTPTPGAKAEVEADILAYDIRTQVISAEGGVFMLYDGYQIAADKLVYNQKTGEMSAEGKVSVRDPQGNIYTAERIDITEGMKRAVLDSLTLTTSKGALIKATDVNYHKELESVLTDASYSPCGLCIDSKGRKIGWKVNASKLIYDQERALVFLEGAGLELLGVPVAWVPWLVLPDPSQPRAQGFRTPSVDYDERWGARLDVPYFLPVGKDMDLLLTPSLMSRQGLLLGAEFTHRVPWGSYNISASGLYQLDPAAFTGVGNRSWRGAIQTSGEFKPVENWRVGWSYTAFSDAAYLRDYDFTDASSIRNHVYATYLTRDLYFDARVAEYKLLGNVTAAAQGQQGAELPRLEGASYHDLGDFGRVELSGSLLGMMRELDALRTYNGVPYAWGYEQGKVHGVLEASWQDQYVLPAGLLATPYLGLRLDAANFTRSGGAPAAPYPAPPASGVSLLEATPIAALDVRWPLMATSGYDSHLFEPVAQIVYRGSSTTLTGITNDDAQSFVFDDTLLFSYNRFSGTDRQETGLRANVGGRYMANFSDGSWLQLIAGQSYHLAGLNALGVADHAQTGNSTGLENTASYIVAGANGALAGAGGARFGGKVQFDPNTLRFMRAAAATNVRVLDAYDLGASYTYIAANPLTGTVADQHEATVSANGPLPFDYWYANGSVSWDLGSNQFLEARAGVTYDDGYFVAGVFGQINGPTHESPGATTVGIRFRLRGPDGDWGL